jgi:hypothetical protein
VPYFPFSPFLPGFRSKLSGWRQSLPEQSTRSASENADPRPRKVQAERSATKSASTGSQRWFCRNFRFIIHNTCEATAVGDRGTQLISSARNRIAEFIGDGLLKRDDKLAMSLFEE